MCVPSGARHHWMGHKIGQSWNSLKMGTYKDVKLVVIILFSMFNPTLALQSFSITLYHQGTDYFKLDLYLPMYNQISSSSGVSISVWHHWLQVFWDVGWCHLNLIGSDWGELVALALWYFPEQFFQQWWALTCLPIIECNCHTSEGVCSDSKAV